MWAALWKKYYFRVYTDSEEQIQTEADQVFRSPLKDSLDTTNIYTDAQAFMRVWMRLRMQGLRSGFLLSANIKHTVIFLKSLVVSFNYVHYSFCFSFLNLEFLNDWALYLFIYYFLTRCPDIMGKRHIIILYFVSIRWPHIFYYLILRKVTCSGHMWKAWSESPWFDLDIFYCIRLFSRGIPRIHSCDVLSLSVYAPKLAAHYRDQTWIFMH